MSTHNSFADKFGREPGQQTVVVQCRHDSVNMKHRCTVRPDEESQYHMHPTPANYDQAINRIDRGNLVFSIGNTQYRGTITDNAIPVVDQVNGMKRKKKRREKVDYSGNQARLAARLADDINVIGVTLGATVPNPESEEDEKNQITVRAHGTTNLFNNSKFSFAPGDTIVWEVPMPEDNQVFPGGRARDGLQHRQTANLPGMPRYGRAATKYTLRVVPLRNSNNSFYEQTLKDVVNANTKAKYKNVMTSKTSEFSLLLKKSMLKMWFFTSKANATDAMWEAFWKTHEKVLEGKNLADNEKQDVETSQAVVSKVFDETTCTEMLAAFLDIQKNIRSRTVGKAFNYAKPGEMIGALLGVA